MKFTAILTASSAFLAMVTAQVNIVSVTTPLAGTEYKAGSEVVIRWTEPKVDTISQIALARGKSTALNVLSVIGKNVDAKAMEYKWTIPYEIENGDDYALEFGTSPDISFAGPFSIQGGVGIVPTGNTTASTPVSPAPAPASPAAPAASSSAVAPAPVPAAPAAPAASSSSPSTTASTSHSSNVAAASHSAQGSAGVRELPSAVVLGLSLAAYAMSQLF